MYVVHNVKTSATLALNRTADKLIGSKCTVSATRRETQAARLNHKYNQLCLCVSMFLSVGVVRIAHYMCMCISESKRGRVNAVYTVQCAYAYTYK